MYRSRTMVIAVGIGLLLSPGRALAAAPEVEKLMGLMPDDLPLTMIVVDLATLDRAVGSFLESIGEDGSNASLITKVKEEFLVGSWIDFSKPIGLAHTILTQREKPLLWANIPQFKEKVKQYAGATQEEGAWHLPSKDGDSVYAKNLGDYVVIAPSVEALARATGGRSLPGKELKTRMDLLKGRQALLHISMESVRPPLLSTLTQGAQMAPMLAMMMSQQGGGDAATMIGVFTTVFDAAQKFVQQINTIDIAITIDANAAHAVLAAGFNDGAIRKHLEQTSPATVPLLSTIQTQPFVLALAYHLPGNASPFIDYIFSTVTGAPAAAPAPAPKSGDTHAPPDAVGAANVTRDFYRKIEGMNMLLTMSPKGVAISGDYLGADSNALFSLAKKAVIASGSLLNRLGGAGGWEPMPSRKIGQATVEEFSIRFDSSNPRSATALKLYGGDLRYAIASGRGGVRFYLGHPSHLDRAFPDRVNAPLGSSAGVKQALAALPTKANAILLVDPAGSIPLLARLGVGAQARRTSPGPPIALALSLSGEPARLDVHVPVGAIKRLKDALGSAAAADADDGKN
ncbi:MAG: hypothetical protein IID38_07170 [Planctomycetes bacterium]|nr:hypothetical protein [Planctomycetota bacterium]